VLFRSFNGAGSLDDIAYDLGLDQNRNIYITGSSVNNDAYATLKYSTDGVQQWSYFYSAGAGGLDEAVRLSVTENGDVYVSGRSYSFESNLDFATLKFNTFGHVEWVARYNGQSGFDDAANNLTVDPNGDVYVVGSTFLTGNYTDYCTIKYSQPAITNWQQVQAVPIGVPLPQECRLASPSPNPFNPSTEISYELRAASYVSLRVYDTTGRLVSTLVNGWREAGTREVTFDGSELVSGVYFLRMQAGEYSSVKKITLLK
jgi:hypothetical protein